MRIHTKTTWQMTEEGLELIADEFYEHHGEVAECKGEFQKQQIELNNKLMQQQLDKQNALQGFIKANIGQYLSGNQGFDPVALALMKSRFLNSNDAAFNDAGEGVRAALVSRGIGNGQLPVGGDFVRNISSLYGQRASAQSQGLMGIDLSDLQQALTNKFNAGSLLNGQAAQLGSNVNTFTGGASSALNAYTEATKNQFLGNLGKGLGEGLGQLVNFAGTQAIGGFGKKDGGQG